MSLVYTPVGNEGGVEHNIVVRPLEIPRYSIVITKLETKYNRTSSYTFTANLCHSSKGKFANVIGSSDTVELSLSGNGSTGNKIQWQVSTNNSTWSNIIGANDLIYRASNPVGTYYYRALFYFDDSLYIPTENTQRIVVTDSFVEKKYLVSPYYRRIRVPTGTFYPGDTIKILGIDDSMCYDGFYSTGPSSANRTGYGSGDTWYYEYSTVYDIAKMEYVVHPLCVTLEIGTYNFWRQHDLDHKSDTITVNVTSPTPTTAIFTRKQEVDAPDYTIIALTSLYPASRQWEMSTDGATFETLVGETLPTLSLTYDPTLFDGTDTTQKTYYYRCVVTSSGGTPLTTNSITTRVNLRKPTVSIYARGDTEVYVPNGITLISNSENTETSYDWEISTDGSTFASTSITTRGIKIAAASNADARHYYVRCSVKNEAGTTKSDPVVIYILQTDLPVVIISPSAKTVVEDTNYILTASTESTDSIAYQWQMSTNGIYFTDISSETGTSVTLNHASYGTYYVRCAHTSAGGTGYTSVATVTVLPSVLTIVSPTVVKSGVGTKLRFSVLGPREADSYTWNMGDETTLTGQTVEYAYRATGTYAVTVTARYSDETGGQT